MEHEEWGERTQIALLIVGAIEILGLVLRRAPRVRLGHSLAAGAGVGAVVCVYEAGEHGGELVYGYGSIHCATQQMPARQLVRLRAATAGT
jgi:hypothetical protein